jgi:hypothetical protein
MDARAIRLPSGILVYWYTLSRLCSYNGSSRPPATAGSTVRVSDISIYLVSAGSPVRVSDAHARCACRLRSIRCACPLAPVAYAISDTADAPHAIRDTWICVRDTHTQLMCADAPRAIRHHIRAYPYLIRAYPYVLRAYPYVLRAYPYVLRAYPYVLPYRAYPSCVVMHHTRRNAAMRT